MVSWKRYALAALVVTRKHAPADAIFTHHPATELRPQETPQAGPDPTTEAFPHHRLERFKRATSAPIPLHTCGYLYGDANQAFTCRGAYFCATYSQYKAFGCCTTTSPCIFPTACLPLESSAAANTADLNRTLFCSNSARPSCAIVQYADPTFSGYTFQLCDSTSTTLPIYYNPQETSLDSSVTSNNGYTLTTSSTTPVSTTTPPPPPPPPPTSTPVGAIVGGVIGGVAALAGIGLVASLMLRRRRKNRAMSPPQQPFVSQPSYPSYGGDYPGHDQRSSIATSAISTPSRGPVPAYSPSRVGQQAQTQGGYWSQIQEMPAASPHAETHEAHELAT